MNVTVEGGPGVNLARGFVWTLLQHPHVAHWSDVSMHDLLKAQPGSQLCTVFTAPWVHPPEVQPDGQFIVEVEGMDVYDPVNNTLHPANKDKIAAWFLDSDYDGRAFCITQALLPDKSKWSKLARFSAIRERSMKQPRGPEWLAQFAFPRPPG